jgi:enoyl-CoA hydratase/carnithine racemase
MSEVEFERQGSIALVRINRPERLNALSRATLIALAEAFTEIDQDPAITVAVLTGTGRAFSVGLDLKEHAESGGGKLSFPDLGGAVNPLFPVRRPDFNTPVIAAVNGLAYGGGYFLFAQCDLSVAAESASFEISEIRQGLVAGWSDGLAHGLPRSIAMELALGGKLGGRRAYEVGLVNDVVEDDRVLERAMERAEGVAKLPPLAVQYGRELAGRLAPPIPAEVSELAGGYADVARASDDVREAMAAFQERRSPVFQGR